VHRLLLLTDTACPPAHLGIRKEVPWFVVCNHFAAHRVVTDFGHSKGVHHGDEVGCLRTPFELCQGRIDVGGSDLP